MKSTRVSLLCEHVARCAVGPMAADTVRELSDLMDELTPTDLGIDLTTAPFAELLNSHRHVTTHTIFSCSQFEVVAFLFPAEARLPLHDHPQMHVFSKVLHGALRMVSYNWTSPPVTQELDAWSSRLEDAADRGEYEHAMSAGPSYVASRVADTVRRTFHNSDL